jgi:hypothetical protein
MRNGPACRPQVDLALGQRGQLLVGDLFLIQRLLQDTGAVVSPKLPGPGDEATITYDFVMFGGLRSVDQRRIQLVLVRDLARDRVGFLDNSGDRQAVAPLGRPRASGTPAPGAARASWSHQDQ